MAPSQDHTAAALPAPSAFYHALLRPAILQILRAQGYYATTPAVLDMVTELAGNYLGLLARRAAEHAAHNGADDPAPTIVDARLAMEECGALYPDRVYCEQEFAGEDDMRGVDEFLRWVRGKKNARIRRVAHVGVPAAATAAAAEAGEEVELINDYLSALKKRHSKTDQDSKYAGTVLGKGLDHGEVLVEGGNVTSIQQWREMMRESSQGPRAGSEKPESRPPSSGLSSLTDGDVEMMEFS